MGKKEFTKKQLRKQLTVLTEAKSDIKSELEEEVEKKNERSEGHGKMYNALSGIKEGKVIKMTESTLKKIVERVVNEQQWPPKPTYEQSQDLKQIKACVNTIQGYQYNREGHSPYIGGTFMTEFMWHLGKSFDKDAENAKEIEYKIKKCFRNTVFWDEYGKSLRFLGDDRKFRQEMKRLERGHIEGDVQ